MSDDLNSGTADPIALFKEWLAEAEEKEAVNPTAMSVATADAKGIPSVRMVLLKQADQRGFVFYTNSESQKGIEIAKNPHASLCFYWKTMLKEVVLQMLSVTGIIHVFPEYSLEYVLNCCFLFFE